MKEKPTVPFFRAADMSEEQQAVGEVLASGWLTTGARAERFETEFGAAVRAPHAVAVNSCTAALHLALEALDVRSGDKVIVPTLTFAASAEVVRYMDAEPVFVDVEPGTNLLTRELVERAVQRHGAVKACVVVHFGGQTPQMGGEHGVASYCAENGIALVEDAAHAFPAASDVGPVGSSSDACCFSFYANKTITTGEGGMLTTSSDAVAARAQVMRLHGIDRPVWNRYRAGASWAYDVVAPGFKYNMPDLNAAVGLVQLRKADAWRAARQRIAERYLSELAAVPGLLLPTSRVPLESHAWHLFPIVITDDVRMTRDEFIVQLAEDGVSTSVHYRPLHRMSYYRDRYQLDESDFPNAEAYWQGCVSLPIFPSMTPAEVELVIAAVRNGAATQ